MRLKDKIAIIGMHCTQFGELWDKDSMDLIAEAAYGACEDAGVELNQLEAVWAGYGAVDDSATGIVIAQTLQLPFLPPDPSASRGVPLTGIESNTVQNPAAIITKDEILSRHGLLYLAAGGIHTTSPAESILHNCNSTSPFASAQALVGAHILGANRGDQ